MCISLNQTDKGHVYGKFAVDALGVNSQCFLEHVGKVHNALEWDMHDLDRGLEVPTRKRAITSCSVTSARGRIDIDPRPISNYVQSSDFGSYDRTSPRSYPTVDSSVINQKVFRTVNEEIASTVLEIHERVRSIEIVLTFLRTIDGEGGVGICALEGGPHKDGADYVVTALVTNRTNLQPESGKSFSYDENGEVLLETVLQPGQGIFQDDRNLLHHITDVARKDTSLIGIRDMIGWDINVTKFRSSMRRLTLQ